MLIRYSADQEHFPLSLPYKDIYEGEDGDKDEDVVGAAVQ